MILIRMPNSYEGHSAPLVFLNRLRRSLLDGVVCRIPETVNIAGDDTFTTRLERVHSGIGPLRLLLLPPISLFHAWNVVI